MTNLDNIGDVISADVLIVGGGIGGLAAAIKVKEENPECDVLIVEKQTTGWAGKATRRGCPACRRARSGTWASAWRRSIPP